jgi:hypothetical protein
VGEIRKTSTILLENLKGRGHSKELGVDGDNIKMDRVGKVWTELIWLRIGTDSGLL